MYSVCIGEIGIAPSEFWLMTYKDVALSIRGYFERELKAMQKTRTIAWEVYQSGWGKKEITSIYQFMPLASDKKNMRPDEQIRAEREFFLNKHRKS